MLVDLETAKRHLRIPDDAHDADVYDKLTIATDEIVAFLKSRADPTWTPLTVPPRIKHAVLVLLTHRYEHRGDDMAPSLSGATPDADVWESIGRMLDRDRDPTLA